MTDAELMDQIEIEGDAAPADVAPEPDTAPKRRRRRLTGPSGPAGTGPAGTAPTGPSDKPPRTRTPRARKAAAKVDSKAVAETMAAVYGIGGAVVCPKLGLHQTGAMLMQQSETLGATWGKLAERYPAIGRVVLGGGDGMLWIELLLGHAPIIETALAERAAIGFARAAARATADAGDISTTPVDAPASWTDGPPY